MVAFCKRFSQSLFNRNSCRDRCSIGFWEQDYDVAKFTDQRSPDDERGKLCA